MIKKTAVGLLIKDRWELTTQALFNILFCTQDCKKYDLYIIDAGSTQENYQKLLDWVDLYTLHFKNIIRIPQEISLAQSWNLFLSITKDYEYRIKMDNDIVFMNVMTPMLDKSRKAQKVQSNRHLEELKNNGINVEHKQTQMIKSPASGSGRKRRSIKNSSFVDLMTFYSKKKNVDLLCTISGSSDNFNQIYYRETRKLYRNYPCFKTRLALITKKAFEKCGYFNENTERMLDPDYCRRIVDAELKLGYHPRFWMRHLGQGKTTEGITACKISRENSGKLLIQEKNKPIYRDTIWHDHHYADAIISKLEDNNILEIS